VLDTSVKIFCEGIKNTKRKKKNDFTGVTNEKKRGGSKNLHSRMGNLEIRAKKWGKGVLLEETIVNRKIEYAGGVREPL